MIHLLSTLITFNLIFAAPGNDHVIKHLGQTLISNILKTKPSITPKHIVINDLRLPSSQKRMWILDVGTYNILVHDYVTHGQGSGLLLATSFSNHEGSHQTSSGVYTIQGSYQGIHGYSLILDGLEKGINDNAKRRQIVLHGAHYASQSFIQKHGRLGRSWGCPAVSYQTLEKIKNIIEPGDLLINITNDPTWIQKTSLLDTSLFT